MAYESAYVFAFDPGGQHQLAGTLHGSAGVGTFTYSSNWLEASWAYPLDPVNLPLSNKRYRVLNQHAVFGVFRDAAPDDWGTRIMLLRHEHAPVNELERLIRTSGGGVGCLRFSLSRSQAKIPAPLTGMEKLQQLARAAEKLEERKKLKQEELELLEPGSSMGGARPKVTVVDDEAEQARWLIKFRKSGDLLDMPLLEYCSMLFLKKHLQLNIPEIRLIAMGKTHAFAIKRFDGSTQQPKHFISANSLFNQDRIRLITDSRRNPYSYCNLASLIRKHCKNYLADNRELFTRMLANIMMGNTDDHARNHAFIYDIKSNTWQLSPAYDMLPIVTSRAGQQAMGVGKYGAQASIENALSYSNLFGLKNTEAKELADHIQNAYQAWPKFCLEHGMGEADVELVKRVTNFDI